MSYTLNIKTDLSLLLRNQKLTPAKEKLLLSSIHLFSLYGYNGVSTSKIAEEANVSEATLFKYFKSKRGLLEAIISPIIDNFVPSYEDIFAEQLEHRKHSDLKSLVHYIVTDRLKFLRKNKEIVCILLSQLLIDDDVRTQLITHLEKNHDANANKIYDIFLSTDELASDIDYSALLRIVMGQLVIYFTQSFLFKNTQINQKDLEAQIYRALKKEA
ncbi:TetR/AcrR family transcriptional regulator [Staphylococcus auricularis]|uniref:TetR/AcrR family transcriptional regulator n=1 Tax=Staphylococcus auricularis TaxID=29379 RepID=UPI003EBCE76E